MILKVLPFLIGGTLISGGIATAIVISKGDNGDSELTTSHNTGNDSTLTEDQSPAADPSSQNKDQN